MLKFIEDLLYQYDLAKFSIKIIIIYKFALEYDAWGNKNTNKCSP